MDSLQRNCVDFVSKGHNLVIVGQAGTGKTYTIKECVKSLRSNGKTVALTCYTGIACLQYKGLGASTLHKFAGLEDGRFSNKELVHLVDTDERYSEIKHTILKTDVLIVDEVSMVSKRILESVEYLCKFLKDGKTLFGGMQVILSGDFYQLPPIKDELYGDGGHYCFQANFFQSMFPHCINLKNVHRQKDTALISCINELEKGTPTSETNYLMKFLERPLSPEREKDVVRLYARNLDVDIYNFTRLQDIQNPLKVYVADDVGDIYYLNKFTAPKRLGIKLDAPVMLLRNLNDFHVNGLVGNVVAFDDDYIRVRFNFDGKSEEINVHKFPFTKYDPSNNSCLAKRNQFPLKLAFSMTIHKSQGMGLPAVEVDCKNATNPGQIGVAIGRAISIDGLRVVNYKPSLCRKHPDFVDRFYESFDNTDTLLDDMSCCRHKVYTPLVESSDKTDIFDSDDDFFKCALQDIDSFDKSSEPSLDHTYACSVSSPKRYITDHTYSIAQSNERLICDVTSLFSSVFTNFIDTPKEAEARIAINTILRYKGPILDWYLHQISKVQEIFKDSCNTESGTMKEKHFTSFYTKFNRYISSNEYRNQCITFNSITFSSQVLASAMFVLQSKVLEESASGIEHQFKTINMFPLVDSPESSAGNGKVRYVGAYCIAKCRHNLCCSLKNQLFVPGMESEIKSINEEIKIIDNMIITATEIKDISLYQETLLETSRKQNMREGLTNINDNVYKFFLTMQREITKLMEYKDLMEKNKYLYKYVFESIFGNTSLLEQFIKNCSTQPMDKMDNIDDSNNTEKSIELICEYLVDTSSHCLKLYRKIVKLFVTVLISQFRKDYLRVIKREKGKALRKKVVERIEKDVSRNITYESIKSDKSKNKNISHFKLKAAAMQNDLFFQSFKKEELLSLLKAYNSHGNMKQTKKELGESLLNSLNDEDCVKMINPSIFDGSVVHETAGSSSTACQTIIKTISGKGKQLVGKKKYIRKTSTKEHSYEVQGTSCEFPVKIATCSKYNKCKSTKTSDENLIDDYTEACGVCLKIYKQEEDWICCDICSDWFHRNCVGLDDCNEWNYFSSTDAIYICPMCQ